MQPISNWILWKTTSIDFNSIYTLILSVNSCGSTDIILSRDNATLMTSPDYPDDYTRGFSCLWRIQGPPNTRVIFDVQFAKLRSQGDYIAIGFGTSASDLSTIDLIKDQSRGKTYQSVNEFMWIIMVSSRDNGVSGVGFTGTMSARNLNGDWNDNL